MMLEHLFIQILNMSLTGSLMILAVLLVRLLLKKAPKLFSYVLWIVVLFRLICPVSFESAFSLLGMLGASTAEQGTIEYISESFVSKQQAGPASTTPVATVSNAAGQGLLQDKNIQENSFLHNKEAFQTALYMCSIIWLIGTAGLLLYGCCSYVRLVKKLKISEFKERRAGGISCIMGREQLYRTDAVSTAFVLGFFRPRIYLPKNLEENEERYILLHEQIHIRRGDALFRTAAYAALCLHWFNPLVWLAFYLSEKDMEMSCDEAVIRQIGNIKKEYSQSLLALATGASKFNGVPLAFGEGDTGSRIKNVLRYKKPTTILMGAAIITCLAAFVFLMGNPKIESIDTVYYGIIKASNQNKANNIVFIPEVGELQIPNAKVIEPYIESEFSGLEQGQLVRMTFPQDVDVNLSQDVAGNFSEPAHSIEVMGNGFDIKPAGGGKYLFAVPGGMIKEAAEGDIMHIYHYVLPEGDTWDASSDNMETVLLADTVIETVDLENDDVWVALSAEEVQTFLREFGFGIFCEITTDSNAQADSGLEENEVLAITPELLQTYGGSLPDGIYWAAVQSIAKSAMGIDRFRVYDLDSEWDSERELPFLAFQDNCTFLVNKELDSVQYDEVEFEEFYNMVLDVLAYREPVLNVAFQNGMIVEASMQNAYFGVGFSVMTSHAADIWYANMEEAAGLSVEAALEKYYDLVRTENADIADVPGQEAIEVYTGNIGDGDSGIVLIRDSNGDLLNTLSAHASRAGWNNIYLGATDGTPYLLEVHIEDRDTYGAYSYEVFRLGENGEFLDIANTYFEFDDEWIGYNDDLFQSWADRLEYFLKNSRLLLSTQEGEIRTDAVSEADKYNYETLRRRS